MQSDNLLTALDFLHEVLPNTKTRVTDARLPRGDSFYKFITESGRAVRYIGVLDFFSPGVTEFELRADWSINLYNDETLYGLMFPIPVKKRLLGRVLIINEVVRTRGEMPYLTDDEAIESWIEHYNKVDGELFYGDVVFLFLDAKAISFFHHTGHFSHTFFEKIPANV